MLVRRPRASHNPPHESHAMVRGAEIYIKLDANGDGIAEWDKGHLIGDQHGADRRRAGVGDGDDHPYVDQPDSASA